MKLRARSGQKILRQICFWTLAGLSCPAANCQPTPQTTQIQPSQAVAAAQIALAHGNVEDALRILSRHLQIHPNDSSARLVLGQTYALAGEHDRAEAELQSVLKQSPGNYVALAALGEIYSAKGQPEKAEPFLAQAVKLSHGTAQIRTEWAVVLARLHRYQDAHNALRGVLPPTDHAQQIAFHRLKASVALGLGDPAAAAAEMEKALALARDDPGLIAATAAAQLQCGNWSRAAALTEPEFSQTHDPQIGLILLEAQLGMHTEFHSTLELLRSTNLPRAEEIAFRQRLAELLAVHGQISESVEEFKQAADLDPTRTDLFFDLALAQFKAGKPDAALETAQKCKALNDSAELEDLIGDIQEARGDSLAAVHDYQAAVALAPTEEKYRLALAIELMRHHNFDAARVVLKQAEQLQPQSWRIQLALGMLEYFAGSDEEASRILERSVQLAPEPETALTYLGLFQMERASPPSASAITKLCGYSENHPADGKIQYYCGALLFRRDYAAGDKSRMGEISQRLRKAAGLLPNDPNPHCQLGKAYRWTEQWQEALRESKTCSRMDPDSAEAHYRLAQIYQHLGDQEQSQAEMKSYEAASKRLEDENAQRDQTMKTFLLSLRGDAPNHH